MSSAINALGARSAALPPSRDPSTRALRALAQDDGPLGHPERAAAGRESKELRDVAQQFESVFVEQLFKAMRATVPSEDGIVTASAGEEIFTGLLDQHLAAETPKQWSGGIADALYRQLQPRLPASAPNTSDR
ncbi:MAG: rod-binding protein [Gemmatimonadaceae bacterium]|jgi:flagellar protein FlgJ|nr:rod-binding protein [Gemmatimonadaceae bacterium]